MNTAPATQPQDERDRLHFLDYWQVISKRKEVIIATAVILILAVAGYSFVVQSQYTATSQIAVQSTPAMHPFLGPAAEYYAGGMLNETDFNTHMSEIVSDGVLQRVIEGKVTRTVWRCNLCGREYSRDQILETHIAECTREGCSGQIGRYEESKYPDWVDLRIKWAEDDKNDDPYPIEAALALLRSRIRVVPERGTRLINIAYTSPDRNEVAAVANMIAEVYAQYQEYESAKRVDDALSALLEESVRLARGSGASPGLLQLEKELDAYKHGHRLLISSTGNPIEAFDFSEFKERKINLEMRIVGLEERLSALEQLDREDQLVSLQGNQSLYDYKRMLAEQKIILNQRLVQFGPEHQEVKRVEQSIKDLEENIDREVEGIIKSMRFDLEALKSEKSKLEESMEAIEKEMFDKEVLLSEYQRRGRDVERLNTIYGQLMEKATMEFISKAIPASRIRVTGEARRPNGPSKPNRIFNILIGIFAGLTVGTGLAYFIEYLDTSVKTIDDLERNLNMPILGVIPQRVKLLTETTHKSPAYEAYRMLWTNIDFARQDAKLRTVLVTSGGVGEGKTTSLVNLAIVIAREGNRVLVIDSDFRRPRVHKLLGLSNQEGLTDVLIRNADPERLALETDVPNLWVLPSGKLPPSSMGLLNSRNMRECIEHLYTKYDIILFDSPPVIGVSDASVLASLVDRIVLVVEYRKYPRSVATRAKKILENVGGRILGGVINNLNIVKEDYYYYSQVYHYFQASGEDTAAADTAQQAPPSPDEDEAPPHEDEQDDTA